jgi:hypothetical protein
MVAENYIIFIGDGKDPRCISFLTDVGMGSTGQFTGREFSQQTFFEAAD